MVVVVVRGGGGNSVSVTDSRFLSLALPVADKPNAAAHMSKRPPQSFTETSSQSLVDATDE